jgi:RNA polymerase sigma-70 factor (ECF subfamily)
MTVAAATHSLQAAIAAQHAAAPSYAATNWPQVLTPYAALLAAWPSPVVALKQAIGAVGAVIFGVLAGYRGSRVA